MKTKVKGQFWTTIVRPQALSDARFNCCLPEYLLEELVNQFHSLGDMPDPLDDPRLQQLRTPFAQGICRFRTREPELLYHIRGLVLQFKVERGNVMVLMGVFTRHPETYSRDMPRRLKESV